MRNFLIGTLLVVVVIGVRFGYPYYLEKKHEKRLAQLQPKPTTGQLPPLRKLPKLQPLQPQGDLNGITLGDLCDRLSRAHCSRIVACAPGLSYEGCRQNVASCCSGDLCGERTNIPEDQMQACEAAIAQQTCENAFGDGPFPWPCPKQ